MYTLTVKVPTKKAILSVQSLINQLGGSVLMERKLIKKAKKTALDEALEDVKNGNLIHCGTAEQFELEIEKLFE